MRGTEATFIRTVSALLVSLIALGQDSPGRRLLQGPEAEQVAFVQLALDRGMPTDLGDKLALLELNRSSLVLPLFELKIEQVLKSPRPQDCFTDPAVDPKRFVNVTAWTIANVGDDEALRQVTKLLHIDEKRFDSLVAATLTHSRNWHNPFTVAYHGFELHDRAVDLRIVTWIESQLSSPEPSTVDDAKRRWSEALVDKYGGAPTEAQWASDPIILGLKPSLAESLHNEMMRMAVDVLAKRSAK